MYNKALILTFFFVSSLFFVFCDLAIDCDCPAIQGAYFKIDNINPLQKKFENGSVVDAKPGDMINFSDYYGIGLSFEVSYFGDAAPEPRLQWSDPVFMPAAWACSCLYDGYLGSKTKLESLTVTTLRDFDPAHPKNASLNDLFTTIDSDLSNPVYIPLDEYLKKDTSNIFLEFMELKLVKAPETDKTFEVKIEMTLSDGRTLSAQTVPLKFN